MKQKLFIFLFMIVLVAILAGLNAASYVQKEKTPDNEDTPNRSSYNVGATGTQAFYTLLYETGRKAVRWLEPPAALLTAKKNTPAVFVIVGPVRREFTPAESAELLQWVSSGGRLVVIDRAPPQELIRTSTAWKIAFENKESFAIMDTDPSDQKQMIGTTAAAKPVQPTVFTSGINAVQPSQFASGITFEMTDGVSSNDDYQPPPPRAKKLVESVVAPSDSAPIVHVESGNAALLIDAPYGAGRIVFLADPFMVSNGGVGLVDNAKLAINMVSAGDGIIAFDEYHQGYGADNNRFLQFFAGTPVVAIFIQAVALIGFIFFSQSRRFARAVPEPEPDRLSKLEYVAAMAELQQRTKAFDLAIENIYTDFRRRVTRLLGLDGLKSNSREIAKAIAERTGLDREKTETTLFKCEEIIRGEPTNKREVVELTGQLRELEIKLGIKRAAIKKI